MSKIILIHRKLSQAQMAHTDADVRDWFNQAFKAISPYWIGKVTGTGLSPTEQKLLMPYLHGVEADDKDFRKKTEKYFDEILTKVPPKGLKLEIGLEDDNKPLGEDNLPLNITEYVAYRHAIKFPQLALSEDEAERSPLKHFFIVDPDHVTSTGLKINELEDQAVACYFKYKDDEIKVDQILTLLGTNIKVMTHSAKVLKLKEVSRKNDNQGEQEQQDTLKRFIEICEDQDIAMKYLLQELVGAQIIEKVGTSLTIKESGELIGNNAREAVIFLKNAKNTKIYNMLRGQYQNVVRKGAPVAESLRVPLAVSEETDLPAETGRKKVKPELE